MERRVGSPQNKGPGLLGDHRRISAGCFLIPCGRSSVSSCGTAIGPLRASSCHQARPQRGRIRPIYRCWRSGPAPPPAFRAASCVRCRGVASRARTPTRALRDAIPGHSKKEDRTEPRTAARPLSQAQRPSGALHLCKSCGSPPSPRVKPPGRRFAFL